MTVKTLLKCWPVTAETKTVQTLKNPFLLCFLLTNAKIVSKKHLESMKLNQTVIRSTLFISNSKLSPLSQF